MTLHDVMCIRECIHALECSFLVAVVYIPRVSYDDVSGVHNKRLITFCLWSMSQ